MSASERRQRVDAWRVSWRVAAFTTLVSTGVTGCGHAPVPPSPSAQAAEAARRDRLPEDNRDLDANWKNLDVKVAYEQDRALAEVDMKRPKLRFFYRPAAAAKEQPHAEPAAPTPDRAVPVALRKLVPFDVESVAVHGGELVFVDMSKPNKPEVWLSKLEVSLENLASRPNLAEGRPVLLGAHARVQSSGDLAVFVSADPWSDSLNFSGRAVLQGLALRDVSAFTADAAQLQVPKGTLDLYVTFTVKDGKITGGVKPLLKNVEIRASERGFWARSKAWFADHVVSLFSDRVRRRNAVATVVPLEGTLEGPKTDLLTILAGVLYNAYLRGLAAGFAGLPPEAAAASARTPWRVARVEKATP